MWAGDSEYANPSIALATASERADVVQGLIPESGITWLYGSSMSFKTFVAMSLASALAAQADWMGRRTEPCAVIYIGAEGGKSLHVRRAAADIATGSSGPLFVIPERPQIDTPLGALRLRGILNAIDSSLSPEPDDMGVEEDVVFNGAFRTYGNAAVAHSLPPTVLCVIDTYSQTSSGDEKSNVAAYIKALRDAIDAAADNLWSLSFLVVDHATKTGGSYMGSVAKLNDVDSQLEVVRVGSENRATIYQRKVKDGIESEPINVELVPVVLEGYHDAYGRVLSSLAVRDGTRAARLASLAEGKAGVLLGILEDEGGRCADTTLRRLFEGHEVNNGIKAESVLRSYKRCKENLQAAGVISESGSDIVAV